VYQNILKKFTAIFPPMGSPSFRGGISASTILRPSSNPYCALLSLIMLGMGVTLSVNSFFGVFKKPSVIILRTLMQYTIMPLAAWIVCVWF
jgi:bile acid:Na+ symporter, BASS family